MVQRTSSACPPILDHDVPTRPHCRKINDYIFEQIKKNKPDRVVLAACLSIDSVEKLKKTIIQLKKMGIKNIDLVGPVPVWDHSVSKKLYASFKSDKFHRIPDRLPIGSYQDTMIQLDTALSDISKQLEINYMSPFKDTL